jgi:hypothetical protein
MRKYIGKNITEASVERLTARLTSELPLPREIKMKDIIAVYSVLVHTPHSPKEIHAVIPQISLKKIRYCIFFMLRYNFITAHRE